MTTTQLAPHAPSQVEIDPLHLSITQRWDSGSTHNVHMHENSDLTVILGQGQKVAGGAFDVPCGVGDHGLVIVALGVDGDHDEVNFQYLREEIDGTEECLRQAVEALSTCLDAVNRIRKS